MFELSLLVWQLLWGAMQAGPDDVLSAGKPRLLRSVGRLPSYTCTETVDRSFLERRGPLHTRTSCDLLLGDERRGVAQFQLTATDRLRVDVLLSDSGREVYSWPGSRRIEANEADVIADGGPFGTGAFGPFLMDIFNNPGVTIERGTMHRTRGKQEPASNFYEYRFRVPLKSSHYQINTGGGATIFQYDGLFWMDAADTDLKRLVVRSAELPASTGVCEATTTVDFTRSRFGDREVLIPRESRLRFVLRNGDASENVTKFANCHQYSAESVLRFDDTPEAKVAEDPLPSPDAKPLPAGLSVDLRLEAEIDTETAAAGDAVVAAVVRDVNAAGMRVKAGSLAHGRVVKAEHRVDDTRGFLLAIRFETLEVAGVVLPFKARLPTQFKALPSGPDPEKVTSRTALPKSGTFVIRTKARHYVLAKGYVSTWITE